MTKVCMKICFVETELLMQPRTESDKTIRARIENYLNESGKNMFNWFQALSITFLMLVLLSWKLSYLELKEYEDAQRS